MGKLQSHSPPLFVQRLQRIVSATLMILPRSMTTTTMTMKGTKCHQWRGEKEKIQVEAAIIIEIFSIANGHFSCLSLMGQHNIISDLDLSVFQARNPHLFLRHFWLHKALPLPSIESDQRRQDTGDQRTCPTLNTHKIFSPPHSVLICTFISIFHFTESRLS